MRENLANFEMENEKVCKSCKISQWNLKVWTSGNFLEGDWKSMKIWLILRIRSKKYENLANFERDIEKVWNSGKFWQVVWISKNI